MEITLIQFLWFVTQVTTVVSVILDRAPTLLKHGGPHSAFVLLFAIPIGVAFGTVATGFEWWVVALVHAATLALCVIIAFSKGGAE